jgi:hypothetical protein
VANKGGGRGEGMADRAPATTWKVRHGSARRTVVALGRCEERGRRRPTWAGPTGRPRPKGVASWAGRLAWPGRPARGKRPDGLGRAKI